MKRITLLFPLWAGLLTASTLDLTPTLGSAGDITASGHAPTAAQSGVARLAFSTGVLCSGVAISPTVVLTSAHCIGTATGVTASFTDSGSNSGDFTGSTFLVNPGWTGDLGTGVDLALVYLTSPLASWVTISELYNSTDEVGRVYQVAGWGSQASNGAAAGSTLGFGVAMRVGHNTWDSLFVGFNPYPNRPDILVADFDGPGSGVPLEVTVAPGDSGGPSFLDGKVAGITSFSASVSGQPTGAYGEYNGMTRISSHLAWIQANAGLETPEPSSLALVFSGIYLVWAVKRRSASS